MTASECKQLQNRFRLVALSINNRNGIDVEDLVQEAFCCLLKSGKKYKNLNLFAKCRMIDYIRKHGVALNKHKNKDKHRVYLSQEEWIELVTSEEKDNELGVNLNGLTETEKSIITRMYCDGKKRSVIARELGLPRTTVINRWNVAIAKLRSKLV